MRTIVKCMESPGNTNIYFLHNQEHTASYVQLRNYTSYMKEENFTMLHIMEWVIGKDIPICSTVLKMIWRKAEFMVPLGDKELNSEVFSCVNIPAPCHPGSGWTVNIVGRINALFQTLLTLYTNIVIVKNLHSILTKETAASADQTIWCERFWNIYILEFHAITRPHMVHVTTSHHCSPSFLFFHFFWQSPILSFCFCRPPICGGFWL